MVLHIISSLETGGAQKLLSELLPVLERQGEEVALLVYRRENNALERRIEEAGIPIYSLDIANSRSVEVIPALRKAIKGYDRVHVHLFPSLYQVALAAMGTRHKLFFTEHSTSNRRRDIRLMRSVEQYVYGRYRRIIAISEATRESLVKWIGDKYGNKVVTVENGINLKRMREAKPSPQFPNQRYVLMVSRFVEAKDQATLIKAIPHVKDKEVLFMFAGDGPQLAKCRELARSKGVEDRCVFLGNRDDIPELIAGSLMGVQSSRWEGFGLTAVEFMAAGKPVLGSDVAGLRDVIGDKYRIFKVGDHKQLARMIDATLENPRPNTTDFSRYDIERMASDYISLYKS